MKGKTGRSQREASKTTLFSNPKKYKSQSIIYILYIYIYIYIYIKFEPVAIYICPTYDGHSFVYLLWQSARKCFMRMVVNATSKSLHSIFALGRGQEAALEQEAALGIGGSYA